MNESKQASTNSTTSSMKMLRAMVGIGVLCALLIVLTYEGTKPRIMKLKAEALEKAIFNVIPEITYTITYQLNQNNTFTQVSSEGKSKQLVYAGYDENDNFMGVAVEASGQGYADILRILYGYNPENQEIMGFYVLESKETPGLGDKIEKDVNFLSNFKALDVSLIDDFSAIKNLVITVKNGAKENPWEVDGITGATISSRAIGQIIATSTMDIVPLLYKHRATFKSPKNSEGNE
jgi:Na+-translocating ferredoxin:NAD+ oxidoreductase subunit G